MFATVFIKIEGAFAQQPTFLYYLSHGLAFPTIIYYSVFRAFIGRSGVGAGEVVGGDAI